MSKRITRLTLIIFSGLFLPLLIVSLLPTNAEAAVNCADPSWSVDNEADMNAAIACFNNKTDAGTYTITMTGDIDLTASLTNTQSSTETAKLVIEGNGFEIDGQNISGIRPFYIEADTDITLQNMVIKDGTMGLSSGGGNGGAIYNNGGIVNINQVLLTGNTGRQGGAISNRGHMTITHSVIRSNTATPSGGGAGIAGAILQDGTDPSLYVENSTVTGNVTAFFDRAIIKISTGTAEFVHTTIANNSDRGLNATGTITLTNSILAGNSTASCYSGTPVSGGYNIVDDTSCNISATGDMTNTSPVLDSFIDNNNYTSAYKLAEGSPALNVIPNGVNGCATTITSDQIGTSREQESACEIGSIEMLPQVALTVTKTGNGDGTVTSLPSGVSCGETCSEEFEEGADVVLTASAATGSTFGGWTGDATGSSNPITTTLSAEKTISATFTLLTYTLDLALDGVGSGSVSSTPSGIDCEADCSETFDYGTVVTLTAAADSGSIFAGWSGDLSGTTNPVALTVDAAKNVTATYTTDDYSLTVTTDGTGSGSVTKSPDQISYSYGTTVTLTANPADGSEFMGWSGDGLQGETAISVTVVVDGDLEIGATFDIESYEVTVETGGSGSGSVTLNPDLDTYQFGVTTTLSATPETGSTFGGWQGDACSGTEDCVLTVDGDKSVTAIFLIESFPLTVSTAGSGDGAVTQSPDQAFYDSGSEVVLTAAVEDGSIFEGWSGDASGTTNPLTITIDAAQTITATFTAESTGQQVCAQQTLQDLLNSSSATIELDGNCNYLLDSTSGSNGHILNIWSRTNKVINGNGATISQAENAADLGMILFLFGDNITIRDVTFTGAHANGSDWFSQRGGALMLYKTTNMTLENVSFKDNKATKTGAGFFVYKNSSATLIDVLFDGNELTYTEGASFGGGLAVTGGSSVEVRNSLFKDNRGYYGGGIYTEGPLTVTNSVFADNVADKAGAAIYSGGSSSVDVVNSTFVANNQNSKEALYAWGTMTVSNSIIANHATGLAAGGHITEQNNLFAHNDIDKRVTSRDGTLTELGDSVATSELNFMDEADGNYRLQSNSPAIDRGDASSGGATDADGNPRPFSGTGVDVGAFEYQGEGIPAITLEKQGPIWFKSGDQIPFDLIIANASIFTATNVVVSETLPAGVTFVEDSMTDNGEYADGVLTWSIASLAPGEDLRLEYMVTSSASFTSDSYEAISQDEPAVNAVGEALMTTINLNLIGNLNFFPQPDGFSFPNYGDSPESDFTVDDMVLVYGADAVCKTQDPCVLTAAAEQWRQAWLENVKGGHCAGMAVSSLQLFANDGVNPDQFQNGAEATFDLTKSNIRRQIALYAITQTKTPANWRDLTDQGIEGGYRGNVQVLDVLSENLADPDALDRYRLGFNKLDGGGGHAVTPYAVEQKTADIFWIYVYDNNYPNNFDRIVKVNRTEESWIYEGAATKPGEPVSTYRGTADSDNQLRLASLTWAQSFPKICDSACSTPNNGRNPWADDDLYQFQLDGEGYILVTRNDGLRVGYDLTTGELINEIDDSSVIALEVGMGFNLPDQIQIPHTTGATYSVQLASRPTEFGNFASPVNLNITGPGVAYRFTGLNLDTPQDIQIDVSEEEEEGTPRIAEQVQTEENDVVTFQFDPDNYSVTFEASEIDGDTPDIAMAIDNRDGEDFTFELNDANISAGTELDVSFDPETKQLSFTDTDVSTDSTYNVTTSRTNQDGTVDTVEIEDVTSGNGAGGSIDFNDWDGESTPDTEQIEDVVIIYLPVIFR